MKRLLRPLAVGAVTASLITGVAGAQSTSGCSIVNTGPGSVNTCNDNNNSTFTVSCDNKVQIDTVNGQYTTSGDSAVIDNTTGGASYSGNAVTTNNTTNKLNISCVPASQTSTTPSTPSQGGKGAVASAQTQQTASLPNTGSNPLAVTAIIAGILGAAAVVSRLGAKLYGAVRS